MSRAPWEGRRGTVGLLALAAVVGLLPLVWRTPYALSNLVLAGLYTIVTLGLCLLMGYAGQVSLGQAAFFGLGAYGSAVLTVQLGWSPWLALVVSAAGVGALAYLVGIPIFRLQGHYLAMGTLALGAIVHIVLTEWRDVTGGPGGLGGIPRLTLGPWTLRTDLQHYYLVWGVALLALGVTLNVVNSRVGRALVAIRGAESAARSLGVEAARYKLVILALSAVYASVAGSLYAHYMAYISPGAFDFGASVRLVLMAALGGLASVWGAPLGATGVLLLTMALREVVPLLTGHGSGEYQIILYGLLLVAIMIFSPNGLTSAGSAAWRRLGGLRVLRRLRAGTERP